MSVQCPPGPAAILPDSDEYELPDDEVGGDAADDIDPDRLWKAIEDEEEDAPATTTPSVPDKPAAVLPDPHPRLPHPRPSPRPSDPDDGGDGDFGGGGDDDDDDDGEHAHFLPLLTAVDPDDENRCGC